MIEQEKKPEREIRLNTVGKLQSALGIIMNSDYAASFIDPRTQKGVPMDDRVMEVLCGILQADGIPVINEADEEIPKQFSYGSTFINIAGKLMHHEPELSPELVDLYLDVRSRFPDTVINYRLGGGGMTVERRNPAYDPSKGKDRGRNRRFLPIPTTPF